MSKRYTGIGSRDIPYEYQERLKKIALLLEKKGYMVYTGDADGSDACFRVVNNKKVFTAKDCTKESMDLAKSVHPAWEKCSPFARKLLGRNPIQLLDRDLKSPSDFVIAYTKNAKVTGGSAIVLNLAKQYKIPIFNIASEEDIKRLSTFLKSL